MRIGLDGYGLSPVLGPDRAYFLSCIRKTVLESVRSEEAAASDLWIDGILGAVETNLDGIGMKNEAFILKREDGRMCGILWLGESKDQYTCDDTGYLLGIYVEEELRGFGLGRALLQAAEQWCGERGFLSLTLNVGSMNKDARTLYEGNGFCERSAVMRKDLLPPG